MAQIAVQTLPANGKDSGDLTFAALSATGDYFLNTGREIVLVQYATATNQTITVSATPADDSGRATDVTITGAAAGEAMCGPFKPRNFNSGNQVVLTPAASQTGTTVAVVRLQNP